MDQSPSVQDTIHKFDILQNINIYRQGNVNYINKSVLEEAMTNLGVIKKDIVISNICAVHNIDEINVIDDSSDLTQLLESIDSLEIMTVAQGISVIKQFIHQAAAFVSNREYDRSEDVSKYIKKCDKVLADIKEEKENIKAKKKTKSYQFTLVYLWNMSKDIISFFILPIMTSKSTKLPSQFVKIIKLIATNDAPKVVKVIQTIGFASSEVSNLKKLYLSVTDYEKLLDEYEKEIKSMRKSYKESQDDFELAKRFIKKETNTMLGFKEFDENLAGKEVGVHYMTPEELEVKNNTSLSPAVSSELPQAPVNKEIMHDDKEEVKPETPVVSDTTPPEVPMYNRFEPKPIPPAEFNPAEAIASVKAQPDNIIIARYGDHHFVDMKDLMGFMHNKNITSFEKALNDLISAHPDDNMDATNIRVILTKNDLAGLNPEICAKMEASEIEFSVY